MREASARPGSDTVSGVQGVLKGSRTWGISGILVVLATGWMAGTLWGVEVTRRVPLTKEMVEKRFQAGEWNKDAPVDIRSERMTVDFEAHRVVFSGNVRVRQADFSLSAREVTTTFGETADDILKIVAEGDVKIQRAEKAAWGQRAVYDRKSATIVLTGEPVLRQGGNFIRGDEIRVRLDADRMEVMGGVEAEFRLQDQGAGEAQGVH